MTDIRVEADIKGSAAAIFDAIVDLRGYDRWLPRSKAFPGTTEISPGPMGVGTSYVEAGADGARRGTITEFDRPTRVTFHQPMTMKPRAFGVIDIVGTYTLTPGESSIHVVRVNTVKLPFALKALQPVVVRTFRIELERTVTALKAFIENPPTA